MLYKHQTKWPDIEDSPHNFPYPAEGEDSEPVWSVSLKVLDSSVRSKRPSSSMSASYLHHSENNLFYQSEKESYQRNLRRALER